MGDPVRPVRWAFARLLGLGRLPWVGRRAAKLSVPNARTCGAVGAEPEVIGEMRDIEDETDFAEVSAHRMDEIVDEDQMPEREREDFSVWTVGEARK